MPKMTAARCASLSSSTFLAAQMQTTEKLNELLDHYLEQKDINAVRAAAVEAELDNRRRKEGR